MVLEKIPVLEFKKGQIWVESVIYTLIGLSLIGLVLAISVPKINELQDKAIIEQTIGSMRVIDSKIEEVSFAPGNRRIVEINLKRGKMVFDTLNEQILYEMDDSRAIYSEPNISIMLGKINVTTLEGSKRHNVKLIIDYPKYNFTLNGEDGEVLELSATGVPNRIAFESTGFSNEKILVDISRV